MSSSITPPGRGGYGWGVLAVMSSCVPSSHSFLFINDASVMSPGLVSQRPNNCFTVIGEKGLSGSWKQLLNKHQLKLKKEFSFSFPLKIISVSCFLWIQKRPKKILLVWSYPIHSPYLNLQYRPTMQKHTKSSIQCKNVWIFINTFNISMESCLRNFANFSKSLLKGLFQLHMCLCHIFRVWLHLNCFVCCCAPGCYLPIMMPSRHL